jgi:RNA polymerase sigma-70 factor (ECF subfamily)
VNSANDPGSAPDDAQLLHRVAQRDTQAFAQLYDHLSGTAYSMAMRVLADPHESEEVVRQAFLQLWETAVTHNTGADLRPYHRIVGWVRTMAVDRLRALRRHYDFQAEGTDTAIFVANPAQAHGAEPYHREPSAAARRALEGIPLEDRQALEMAYLGGMTASEIADRLAQPPATIRTRIRRGVQRCRELAGGEPGAPDPSKEQALLYAAGALNPSEAREFESLLKGNIELQLWVSESRRGLERLPAGLPRRTPSPALRARLVHEIERRAAALPVVAAAAPFHWLQLLPWALCAVLSFLCVYLATHERSDRVQLHQLEQRLSDAVAQMEGAERRAETQRLDFQQQRAQINQQILEAVNDQVKRQAGMETRYLERLRNLERANNDMATRLRPRPRGASGGESAPGTPEAVGAVLPPGGPPITATQTEFLGLLRPKPPAGSALGAVSWEAREQRGTIVIEALPVPAADKDYQLWIVVDGTPISGGLLNVDASGGVKADYIAGQRIDTAGSWFVTLDPKGGASSPSGTLMMTTTP